MEFILIRLARHQGITLLSFFFEAFADLQALAAAPTPDRVFSVGWAATKCFSSQEYVPGDT